MSSPLESREKRPFLNSDCGALTSWVAAALVALFPLVLKVIKAWSVTEGQPGFIDLMRVATADLVFGVCVGAGFVAAQRLLGRVRAPRGRTLVCTLITFVTLVVLGLSAVEHQVWTRTASLLDWGILAYTIRHYRELSIVIASETNTASIVLLIVTGVLAFLPVLLDVFLGHRMQWVQRLSASRLVLWLPMPVLALGLVVNGEPSSRVLAPMTKSAAFTLIAGAISGAQHSMASAADHYTPSPDATRQRIERQLDAAKLVLAPKPDAPKNVLLFILESTRADATTLYDPNLPTTPRLARMAEHGALALNVHAEMPHTSKAIASVVCGYSPRWSVEINESEVGGLPTACAPHVFGKLGFETAFFQSAWGTFESRRQFAENAGFSGFYARESLRESRFAEINYLAVEDKAMVSPILSFAEQSQRSGKPFFATVMTCGSHHNYGLPTTWKQERYSRKRPSGAVMPTPWDDYNRYLNTVRYVDEFIGEVVRGLASRKLLDDTLIVVVGDHGQGFMEHGQKYHNETIHEEGLRVPLLFYNEKAFPEPKRIAGLRRQQDVVPTIMSLVGVTPPSDMFEGKDLLASSGHARTYSNCWYDDRCAAEFEGDLKVIDFFKQKAPEVYDLAKDPYERENLLERGDAAARARYAEVARAAQERIHAEKQRIEAHYRSFDALDRSFLLDKAPKPGHAVPARLDSYIELLGYDASGADITPGGTWDAVVYFRCLQPSPPGWRLFTRLVSVDNRKEQVDYDPANGRFDLTQCKAGSVIADRLRVWIPEDFPAGPLDIYWGSVFLPEKGSVRKGNTRQGERAVIALERGVLVRDDAVRLARTNIAPHYREDLAQTLKASVLDKSPNTKSSLEVRFGDGLVLEDFRIEPREARPFSPIKVITTWRVEQAEPGPWQVYAYMDTPMRKDRRKHTPVDGLHPVANWQPGTWVRDSHTFILPRWIERGEVELWLSLGYERKHMPITDAGNGTVDTRKRLSLGKIKIR